MAGVLEVLKLIVPLIPELVNLVHPTKTDDEKAQLAQHIVEHHLTPKA